MENNNEIVKVEQAELSQIAMDNTFNSQVDIAKRYPRNIHKFLDNAIATITRNDKSAAQCGYNLPRAGKQIQGASVHLARIMAQLYGNLRVQVKAGEITQNTVTAQAIAYDLESNYGIEVTSLRNIIYKSGKRYDQDMINTTMLAAMAVAERNAILKVIPKAFTDELYEEAQKKLTGDLSDETKLIKRRKDMVDFFKKQYNVNEHEILKLFGKATLSQITPEDIASLIGLVQALKDGDATIEETFNRKSEKEVKADEADLDKIFKEEGKKVDDSSKKN